MLRDSLPEFLARMKPSASQLTHQARLGDYPVYCSFFVAPVWRFSDAVRAQAFLSLLRFLNQESANEF